MEEIFSPSKFDLIREALIIFAGLIVRYFEKRKLKNPRRKNGTYRP